MTEPPRPRPRPQAHREAWVYECRPHLMRSKRSFPDKYAAWARLREIWASPDRTEKFPVRAYECEGCKLWFLTSQKEAP